MERELVDIQSEHTAFLHRYSTGTLNKIIAEIMKSGAEVSGKVFAILEAMTIKDRADFVAGKYSTKRSKELRDEIKQLSISVGNSVKTNFNADTKALAAYEIKYAENLLKTFVILPEYTLPTAAAAYAVASAKPACGPTTSIFTHG